MADLLTLSEYKALMGILPGNTRDDAKIEALIPAVSRTILAYVDRDFEPASAPATERVFEYDLSGYLDIDDCTGITGVTTDAGVVGQTYTLTTDEFTPQPSRGEVYYYLLLHGRRLPGSAAMGFTRNLDQLGYTGKPVTVAVTALWGWPAVPTDVKLAAAWTIDAGLLGGAALQSESIAGFSRTWAAMGGPALSIPNRARDILANYERITI